MSFTVIMFVFIICGTLSKFVVIKITNCHVDSPCVKSLGSSPWHHMGSLHWENLHRNVLALLSLSLSPHSSYMSVSYTISVSVMRLHGRKKSLGTVGLYRQNTLTGREKNQQLLSSTFDNYPSYLVIAN